VAMRIGQGWDRHRLAPGRPCVLGGVTFPDFPVGPVGHSDADAVCHAIIDAVLGAAGLGDIGDMFPDTDPAFAGADSRDLLATAWGAVRELGWYLVNLDVVIICEGPAISPMREEMRAKIAATLGSTAAAVNIKATRGEGMGPEGRGECVTVQAVALLEDA